MSRIGRMPITVPAGVTVSVSDGNIVSVKGAKGELSEQICPSIKVSVEGGFVNITRPDDAQTNRSLHGLSRTLIANMVEGVVNGFKKELDINGVGYKAVKEGKKLVMNLGYSHQVILDEVDGILVEVPAPTKIIVSGIDKQLVGQFAADVRKQRPPEPYKGKGIKYSTERIRRKEGKTGSKKK